jgi:hypothetical protein
MPYGKMGYADKQGGKLRKLKKAKSGSMKKKVAGRKMSKRY